MTHPDGGENSELHRLASLGRTLAGLVHEIGTPVASLASNNEVLLRGLDSLAAADLPADIRRKVETLRDLASVDRLACERLTTLVRGVKRLARGASAELVAADVNELLRDSLQLAHHEFKLRITVETDLGELAPVMCAPHSLGQVFLNLLVNAAQAIEGQGRITVRTRPAPAGIDVWISDTGRGIGPADREKVFSSGFTTKPPGAGAGLGLAICKEIIARHGGQIDFESSPGAGATFHIRIPTGHSSGGAGE